MELVRELLLDSTPRAILVVALCKASLLLAVAQLLVNALPSLSASTKHLMLTAALAAFVAIPALALFGPDWRVSVAAAERVQQTRVAAPQAPAAGPAFEPVASGEESEWRATEALLLLWAAGALTLFLRLGRSVIRLRRIVREADEVSPRLRALLDAPGVRLLRSDRVAVPMVWGVRRGTLLLPASAEEWTDEELRVTFLHELAHLRRLDYVSLFVMNVAAALAWFQPQVWMARRGALMEGERACDDAVLRAGARPSDYASHLLEVARAAPRREPLAAFLAMSRRSQLEGRMLAILSPSTNRRAAGAKALLATLALFATIVMPFATLQLFARPAQVLAAAVESRMKRLIPPAPVAAPAPLPPATMPPARMRKSAPAAPPAPAFAPAPELSPLPPAAPAPLPAPPPPPAQPSAAEPPPDLPPDAPEPPSAAPVAPPEPRLAPEPPAPPPIPFLESAAVTRPYRVLRQFTGRAYTLKLNRPNNTGDPSRNPAEELARRRLATLAAKKAADAVLDVRCGHELRIGFAPPTSESCTGQAIVFTDGPAR